MSGQLYKAPNGESFGFREASGPCPFGFMSAEKSWRYLPDIGDGHVGLSIRYPDHISASNPDTTMRMLMAHVPRFLRNNSWRAAIDTGRLHEVLWAFPQINEKMREDCRTYKRVSRDGLCRTITTTPTPQCTRTGTWVHHDANRLITVQEARIAQGYPDSDLLVGTPKNRLHVIGNSVARGVSLALGIGLREAYLASGSGGGFGAREKVRRVGAGGEAYGVVGEEGDGGAGVVIWGRIDRRKYVVIEDDSDVEMAEEKMVEG